jgi:hypothetical protein
VYPRPRPGHGTRPGRIACTGPAHVLSLSAGRVTLGILCCLIPALLLHSCALCLPVALRLARSLCLSVALHLTRGLLLYAVGVNPGLFTRSNLYSLVRARCFRLRFLRHHGRRHYENCGRSHRRPQQILARHRASLCPFLPSAASCGY